MLNHRKFGLDNSLPPEEYWPKVFQLKNSLGIPIYPNLKIAVGMMLSLPCSNASLERIFGKLKLVKTEHRNKLKTDTIAAILFTKDRIERQGGCLKFAPTKNMLNAKILNKNK